MSSLFLGFAFVLCCGLFALGCCLSSLLDPSERGQVLCRLKSLIR
jgi:hypothetical protein